jgi:hypothetical protein
MIQRVTNIRRIFSLSEKEYIIGSATVSLAPSLAVLQKSSRSSNEDDIGLYLNSISGDSACSRFWPIHYPIRTVQAFRALRLLEECPKIEDDALCACYYAMSRDLDDTAHHYIESLRQSGFKNVEECRKNILMDRINRSCFIENVLNPIVDAGATICAEEVQREINLGVLTNDTSKRYILPLKNQVAV